MSEEELQSLETLALQSEEVRMAVLEVSPYPVAWISVKRIQQQSQTRFIEILKNSLQQDISPLLWARNTSVVRAPICIFFYSCRLTCRSNKRNSRVYQQVVAVSVE